jgi:hypothetical protein
MAPVKSQVIEQKEVILIPVKRGTLTKESVKNEGSTGYIYENTGT